MMVLGLVAGSIAVGVDALSLTHGPGIVLAGILEFIAAIMVCIPGSVAGGRARWSTGKARYGILAGLAVGVVGGLMAAVVSLLIWSVSPQLWLAMTYAGAHPPDIVLSGFWAFASYLGTYAFIGAFSGVFGAWHTPRQTA